MLKKLHNLIPRHKKNIILSCSLTRHKGSINDILNEILKSIEEHRKFIAYADVVILIAGKH